MNIELQGKRLRLRIGKVGVVSIILIAVVLIFVNLNHPTKITADTRKAPLLMPGNGYLLKFDTISNQFEEILLPPVDGRSLI